MQISGGAAGDVVRQVLKTEGEVARGGQLSHLDRLLPAGLSGLYKGLTPTLIRTCSASGCLFIAYEYSKKYMQWLLNA